MTRVKIFASVVPDALVIFLVAVTLNYLWEVAQAPLFLGMTSWSNIGWHCFVASLGDGVLIWILHAIGCAMFRRVDWYCYPTIRVYSMMLFTGLLIGLGVEWIAINVLHRWAYSTTMPLIPGLEVGFIPVIQMLVLPPLIFLFVSRWKTRKRDD